MAEGTLQDAADFLKNMKFKKKLLGGVSEEDVWRNLEKLDKHYQAAFEKQRIRYETLLEEREKEILRLRKQAGSSPESAPETEVQTS